MRTDVNCEMDIYLRNEFGKLDITAPESYDVRLKMLLDNLPERKKKYLPIYIFRPAAAIFICAVVVLVSTGVYAGVREYMRRLQNIDRNEIKQIDESIQKYKDNEADIYSRPLTKEEEEREKILREEYENGRFPAEKMKTYQKVSEVPEGEFCYCYENSCIYMPKEGLSDEQLLELIDLNYTRDYAVSEMSKEREDTLPIKDEGKITKKKAKGIIEEFIKYMYGVDISGIDSEMEITKGIGYIEDKKTSEWEFNIMWTTDKRYCVDAAISSESGKIDYFDYYEGEYVSERYIYDSDEHVRYVRRTFNKHKYKLEEEKYIDNKEAVLSIKKYIVADTEFKDIIAGYYITEDNKLYDGEVTYYVVDENGKGYEVGYNYNIKKLDYIRTEIDLEDEREIVKEIIENRREEYGIKLKYKERKIGL